jgi:hypothetical protein
MTPGSHARVVLVKASIRSYTLRFSEREMVAEYLDGCSPCETAPSVPGIPDRTG